MNFGESSLALSDEQVVAQVCAGDRAIFEVIMRRYNQRLFRAARAILRDDDEAEDVLQEAYVQAYTHLGGFEGRARLSTWLTRIVVHEALRRVRRRQRLADGAIVEQPPTTLDPEKVAGDRELARVLEHAIDELPEAFRTVFVLRVVERLDVAETAACLGIADATVKTRLHRARALLRRTLEQHAEEALVEVHRFLGLRCDRVVARVLAELEVQ